jgi:hypothetical protein
MEFVPSVDTKLLYERLCKAQPGETIPYQELSTLIGRDITNGARHLLTSATRLARKENQIVFRAHRTVGIRRLTNSEIANSGKARQRSVRRKSSEGIKDLECADFADLPSADKVSHNTFRTLLAFLHKMTSPSNAKQLEAAVAKADTALTFAKTLEAFKK